MKNLEKFIRDVPDFPKQGIIFKDITPLLNDGKAYRKVIKELIKKFKEKKIDVIVGAESRGFIFSAPIANKLEVGLVPARKPGKLPYKTIREEFDLEYGKDAFEMHIDAIKEGQNVLIIDDLLATGGTASALIRLVERLKGKVVGLAFLIELSALKGREKLKGYDVETLIKY